MAEAVVQESNIAQQYAAATLVESLRVSLSGLRVKQSDSASSSGSYVQQLVTPAPDVRSQIQLQQALSCVQDKERRLASLEEQLLQPNPTAIQQGTLTDASRQSAKVEKLKMKGDPQQISRLRKYFSAQETKRNLAGHSEQLKATWPLQAAPTYQQQAFAAAHAARGFMQVQTGLYKQPLQPVQPVALPLQWCSSPPVRARQTETAYWQKVSVSMSEPVSSGSPQLPLQLHQGHVTAIAASLTTTRLAIGTQLGFVTVLILDSTSTVAQRLEGKAAASGVSISGAHVSHGCAALHTTLHTALAHSAARVKS